MPDAAAPPPDSPSPSPSAPARVPVCGIGASAGGVEALQQLFTALPADVGLAYVVIVHLAPDRKSELPAIIARATRMPVVQVADNDRAVIAANHVYVIAPDRKLEITDSAVSASPFAQRHGQRTAIDLFFRSLAAAHRDGFAVVLSGSGADGALGAKSIKEGGGLVLVQDPAEATHADMPRAVIAAGVADVVLPVRALAARLAALASQRERLAPVVRAAEAAEPIPEDEEKAFRGVLDQLRKRTGNDFSKYKRSTVLRRLSRRMQITHQPTIADYLRHARAHVEEVQALFDDLLISVTTFFRDPEAWHALQALVINPLIDRAEPGEQIRVWVPGCASGEEAYSLAMLFDEECSRRGQPNNVIIFASDVDEGALAIGREGVYPRAIAADVPESRLARYFRAEDHHYRIGGDLRDRVVFAAHSLLRDPPFSRLHLISCRNLLIYLDRDLQEQVMGVFQYACRDDGCLFLGASEMADDSHFDALDKRHRIFRIRPRTDGGRPVLPDLLAAPSSVPRTGREQRMPGRPAGADLHLAALEEVAPPTVVVDDRWNVMHLSPSAARFFQQGGGAPARRVTDLVRPELRDQLHVLLQRAIESLTPQLSSFAPVRFNGAPHQVAQLAQQRPRGEGRIDVLVTFLDAGPAPSETLPEDGDGGGEIVRALREKLRQSEARVEGMRDEHFLTTEDLRAANEELQSLNEEYRSTTEELETSKEELQSINEELQTVNQELKLKLEEVSRAHSDLENLMAATNVATLFLGPDLRIKRFTPQLADIFRIKSRDVERPIGDLTHALDYDDLEADARRVLTTHEAVERAAVSGGGRAFVARLSPYRNSANNDVDGVVVTFVDVTAIRQAETALRQSESQLELELRVVRRLHAMTLAVATADSVTDALDQVLAAAVDLHGAQCGSVRMATDRGLLRIVAQQGFGPSYLERFREVDANDPSSYGRAFRSHEIVQVSDVDADADGPASGADPADDGYRAVQAVPLIGRNNDVFGVLSVHFRHEHQFTERDRQLGDLLGHEVAALLEHRLQQDSVQALNETLRHRTAELETSQQRLTRQAEELVQQDRHREEFLAALGHELRNPMAAIHTAITMVAPADESSRRALAVLRRQSEHMTRLVNDLLDINRIKHGRVRLNRQSIDLHQCVRDAIETVRGQAGAKKLPLHAEIAAQPVFVHADPERLMQVLDNLLRNAVTYTDDGAVTVAVAVDGDQARISVRDTGVGIDPRDAPSLFQPYAQLDHARRSAGVGLGLGLTLVKGLVEAHGGTITFSSPGRDQGSEFLVALPLAPAPDPMEAPTAAAAPSLPRRVLVVDDQADVANMLGELLTALGHDVQVAYSGAEGVALARTRRPDVAFVDVSMPEMGGGELAHRLRELYPDDVVVVAVTGHPPSDPRVQAGRFDSYLMKPVTTAEITSLLAALPPRVTPDRPASKRQARAKGKTPSTKGPAARRGAPRPRRK